MGRVGVALGLAAPQAPSKAGGVVLAHECSFPRPRVGGPGKERNTQPGVLISTTMGVMLLPRGLLRAPGSRGPQQLSTV